MHRTALIIRTLLSVPYLCAGLLLLPASDATHSQERPTLKYQSVEYSFTVSSTEADSSGKGRSVTWQYPVFIAGNDKARKALNSWARRSSLEVLASGAEVSVDVLLGKTDSQVVQFLVKHRGFAESGVDQSAVVPLHSFGPYISFQHHTEWTGAARPQHGVQTLYFNTATRNPMKVQSLFRTEALAVLNSALEEKISKERERGLRPECNGREFGWSQVSIVGAAAVGIDFPYNPTQWATCGDGVEIIEGKVVSEQLLNPKRLSAIRPVERLNWETRPKKLDPRPPG